MPTVPNYQTTVSNTALQAPRASGVGNMTEGLARGLNSAAQLFGEIGRIEQESADTAVMSDAMGKLIPKYAEVIGTGKATQGKQAFGGKDDNGMEITPAYESGLKSFDSAYSEIERGLDERHKLMFKEKAMGYRVRVETELRSHAQQQQIAFSNDRNTALLGQYANMAVAAEGDEQLKAATTAIVEHLHVIGAGAATETIDKAMQDTLDDIDKRRVQRFLAEGRIEEAERSASSPGFSSKHPELTAKLTEHKNKRDGGLLGETTVQKYLPKTVDDTLNMEAVRAEIEQSAFSDGVKDYAYRKAEELEKDLARIKKGNEEAASQKIYNGVLQGGKYADLVRDVKADSSIDSKSKIALLDYLERQFGIRELQAEARADARMAQREQRSLTYLANRLDLQRLVLDGKLPGITARDAVKYIPQLGPEASNFARFIEDANKDIGAAKVIDGELVDVVRRLAYSNSAFAKLLPDPGNTTRDSKARMAMLQDAVLQIKQAHATGPGKGISTEQAVLQAIRKVGTGSFFNTQKPLYSLGSDQVGKLSPAGKRSYVIETYTARTGAAPSEQQIQRMLQELNR